jgi:hypothetical protein
MIGVSQEAIVGASAYSRGRPSQIRHHTHEPLILMILVVAVKQRQSRIVGHEIDLDRAESRHIDRIFHHACGRPTAQNAAMHTQAQAKLTPERASVPERQSGR